VQLLASGSVCFDVMVQYSVFIERLASQLPLLAVNESFKSSL
jgi:hypothetical protein